MVQYASKNGINFEKSSNLNSNLAAFVHWGLVKAVKVNLGVGAEERRYFKEGKSFSREMNCVYRTRSIFSRVFFKQGIRISNGLNFMTCLDFKRFFNAKRGTFCMNFLKGTTAFSKFFSVFCLHLRSWSDQKVIVSNHCNFRPKFLSNIESWGLWRQKLILTRPGFRRPKTQCDGFDLGRNIKKAWKKAVTVRYLLCPQSGPSYPDSHWHFPNTHWPRPLHPFGQFLVNSSETLTTNDISCESMSSLYSDKNQCPCSK